MNTLNKQKLKRVLVVAPHPDDAEIAMGGLIISLSRQDVEIHIVDLSNGEPTPHGSPKIRKMESERASSIMKVHQRYCLQMPNRYIENKLTNRTKLACLIRKVAPQIMFTPVTPDEHPDHLATSELVHGSRFEAKLYKTDMPGDPFWVPTLIGYYSPHRKVYEEPDIIVNISEFWKEKSNAISSYKSQLKNSSTSKLNFLEKTQAVNRYFGQAINCKYAEPFKLFGPLQISLTKGNFLCSFF